MNKFTIGTELIQHNAISAILDVPLDWSHEVVIRIVDKTRSAAQNRLLWLWYGVIGNDLGYLPEDLHEMMKAKIFGTKEVITKGMDGKKIVLNIPAGTTTKLKTHSKEPKEITMVTFLDAVEMLACELGMTLPQPDEYKFALTGKR